MFLCLKLCCWIVFFLLLCAPSVLVAQNDSSPANDSLGRFLFYLVQIKTVTSTVTSTLGVTETSIGQFKYCVSSTLPLCKRRKRGLQRWAVPFLFDAEYEDNTIFDPYEHYQQLVQPTRVIVIEPSRHPDFHKPTNNYRILPIAQKLNAIEPSIASEFTSFPSQSLPYYHPEFRTPGKIYQNLAQNWNALHPLLVSKLATSTTSTSLKTNAFHKLSSLLSFVSVAVPPLKTTLTTVTSTVYVPSSTISRYLSTVTYELSAIFCIPPGLTTC